MRAKLLRSLFLSFFLLAFYETQNPGVSSNARQFLGRRVGDHRHEFGLGSNLIAHHGAPGKFANPRTFLKELDLKMQQAAWFDRCTEFRVVDRHEINQLARSDQAKTFHRKHASGLRQRLYNHHARA